MKRLFCLLSVFAFISMSVEAKHWVGVHTEVVFASEELFVDNPEFTQVLDSLVVKSPCAKEKQQQEFYFVMRFHKQEGTHYDIWLELLQLPMGDDALGHFKIGKSFCFVSGEVPDGLFVKSGKTMQFSYLRGELSVIEEFPFWKFDYQKAMLSLTEHHCF